jgi:hypothetical protein
LEHFAGDLLSQAHLPSKLTQGIGSDPDGFGGRRVALDAGPKIRRDWHNIRDPWGKVAYRDHAFEAEDLCRVRRYEAHDKGGPAYTGHSVWSAHFGDRAGAKQALRNHPNRAHGEGHNGAPLLWGEGKFAKLHLAALCQGHDGIIL